MKGFYIENFALRLVFCIVGCFAIWFALQFVMDVVIRHEAFHAGVIDFVIPAAMGITEAFVWKPKN